MNDGLFVLVLNSLYNSPQFTFSLSVLFPPPVLWGQLLYIWTLSPFLTGLSSSCLDLTLPFPHVLYFMLILTTWGCWHFPPFFFLTFPLMLTQQWLSSGTSCCACDIFMSFPTRVCLQSPPAPTQTWCRVTSRISVRVIRLFAICSRIPGHTLYTIRNKIVSYDSDWEQPELCVE